MKDAHIYRSISRSIGRTLEGVHASRATCTYEATGWRDWTRMERLTFMKASGRYLTIQLGAVGLYKVMGKN